MMIRESPNNGIIPIVVLMALVHLVLLCVPLFIIGDFQHIVSGPQILLFLFIATFWCLLESIANSAQMQAYTITTNSKWLPYVIGATILIVFWTSLVEHTLNNIPLPDIVIISGWSLMVSGVKLRYLAIRTLGLYFLNDVALLPKHPLITHGVYAWMRHPSETGTLCIAFGSATLLESPLGFILCAGILLPLIMRRIKLEDRLLKRRHLSIFPSYEKGVPSLFPYPPRLRRLLRK